MEKIEFDLTPEELDVFLQEAEEMLLQLDEGLVRLEASGDDPEIVQRIFRAAHTLKGAAGMIGHQKMADLLHSMETLLDRVRRGRMKVTTELVDVLLAGADAVRVLVGEVDSGEDSGLDIGGLLAQLQEFDSDSDDKSETATQAQTLVPSQEVVERAASAGKQILEVHASIATDSVAPGARALQVLLALQQFGEVAESRPQMEELEEYSEHSVQALVLAEPGESVQTLRDLLNSISEVEAEVTVRSEERADRTEESAAASPSSARPRNNGGGVVGRTESSQVRWVRTSVERLDRLMNLVSELVTDRNRLNQVRADLQQRFGDDDALGELADALMHSSTITDQLQDEVMRARMVPIEHVFSKFPRVVRDLSRQLGKQINLVIEGQETELDRTVIEEINDPLLHLVRNAVDHGVEPPEERARLGKPERGTVRLAARSEENHIIVVVEDDGAGMDPQVMREVAVKKGLLDRESALQLSDQAALELIFLPGFSTAKTVSDVSGRGVGMDVVRTNIERLNGSVSVQSQPGQGTRFELKLPLTLAIFPALMVEVNGSVYALPLTSVVEALKVEPDRIHTIRGREAMVTRGRVLPIVRLGQFFWGDDQDGSDELAYVVEVRWSDTTVGLGVQKLLGRQEVVIKPLGRMIGEVEGISGGTIMGDGRVALIVDIASLVRTAMRERATVQ